jgi:hypothetical protein
VWRTAVDELSASFHAQVTSDDYEFSFSSWSGRSDSVKRMLGCTLLSLLPAPVLDDALSSMSDQLRFYFEDLNLEIREQVTYVTEGFVVGAGTDPEDSRAW